MFDLATCRDRFCALVEEYNEFMEEQHSARRAENCAIRASHLAECVWADWLKRDQSVKRALGVKDQADFDAWVDRQCVWFSIIRELANGAKHFGRPMWFDTMKVTAAPFAFDQPSAGLDEGAWDRPIRYVEGSIPVGPHGKGYLLIDLGEEADNHRWQPAANIIEVVVRFWRDFLRAYRPEWDVPGSPHHLVMLRSEPTPQPSGSL
jgi:hypothetical protein